MKQRSYKFGLSRLTLRFGDITTSDAAILVSSDDARLSMGGGVSMAILNAGGETIAADAAKLHGQGIGDVVVTTAGRLPAHFVFHAVTLDPWGTRPPDAEPLGIVETVTRRSLELATALGQTSIAFPAIGAGVAGFSYSQVAVAMARVISEHLRESALSLNVDIYLFDRFDVMTPIDYIDFFEVFSTLAQTHFTHDGTAQQSIATPGKAGTTRLPGAKLLQLDIALLKKEEVRLEGELSKGSSDAGGQEVKEELAKVRQQRAELTDNARKVTDAAVKLFISYAHKDVDFCDNLKTWLKPLLRSGVVSEWTDHKIVPGAPWEEEIIEEMDVADIILLLLSVDFLASDYVSNKELPRAIGRYEAGDVTVIPIILRPCDWEDTVIGKLKLQALPAAAKPVVHWDNSDDSYLDILRGLKRTIAALD